MAQKTIVVNASASLTAQGTTTATGSITWSVPSLPAGVTAWDSVVISGKWTWNGKGSITRVTINGTNTSDGVSFSVNIPGTSPLSITCVGNKNATGSSFTWSNLVVTYTYTEVTMFPLTVRYGNTIIISENVTPPVAVSYSGTAIASVAAGQTKTLTCANKLMAGNVTIGGHTLPCSGKVMSNNVIVEVG